MSKLLLGLASIAFATATMPDSHATGLAEHVPGEIIIKFKAGVNAKSFFADKSIAPLGIKSKRAIDLSYQSLNVVGVAETTLPTALKILNNKTEVEYAEPNYKYKIAVMPKMPQTFSKRLAPSPFYDVNANVPDDPSFDQLWGLRNTGSNEPEGKAGVEGADVNALKAWDLTKGSRKVKIAVIDTGADYTHPDLKDNMWVNTAEKNGKPEIDDDGNGYVDDIYGYDFANDDADPMDGHGHGTHVAGTIGAVHNNKIGVAGVMADVTMIPIKFLGDDGSGTLEAAIKSIDYASSLDVDLMSNSWGGGGRSEALFEAIKRSSDKGIIFTAAAGNSSSNNDATDSYPANYETDNMISVAALTAQNDLASFSSYGRTKVHIAAPGHNILSTVSRGKYEVMSGTSMATPHVSGVLGLLLAKEGRMPLLEVRERLMYSGVPVTALRRKTITASRADAYNLLTDTRAERTGPRPDAWKTIKLESAFESEHPYKENTSTSVGYTFEGAKYVRVKVAKFDLEKGYDYVRLADKSGNTVEKITGTGEEYFTDYVEGDSIMLNFLSDRSVNKWGFVIEEVQVQ